jgi:hypothetical protein
MMYKHFNPNTTPRKIFDSQNKAYIVLPGETVEIDQIFLQGGIICENKDQPMKRKQLKSTSKEVLE